MAFQVDLDTIKGFRERLPVPWGLDDIRNAAPEDSVVEASWQVLHRVFVQTPMPPIDRQTNGLVELAALILGAVGGWERRSLEGLALANPSPGHDHVLVPLLLTITGFDGDLFFSVLHDALDSDDPERVMRALTLMRRGYVGQFCFRITKGQADALDAVVESRKSLATADPAVRSVLELYIRPAVR